MDKLTEVVGLRRGTTHVTGVCPEDGSTLGCETVILAMHGLEGIHLAVPSSNGFLLSAVLAQILSELLVHGKQHPFLPMILPGRVLQRAVAR